MIFPEDSLICGDIIYALAVSMSGASIISLAGITSDYASSKLFGLIFLGLVLSLAAAAPVFELLPPFALFSSIS
jgi:hypothetical protein